MTPSVASLTAEGAGVFLDYSKNRITDETIRLLVRLAEESAQRIIPELESAIEPALAHDSSTSALIRHYRTQRRRQS